jgi:hypothetical protein
MNVKVNQRILLIVIYAMVFINSASAEELAGNLKGHR